MQQLEINVTTKIVHILEYNYKARYTVNIDKKVPNYVPESKMKEHSTYRTRYAHPQFIKVPVSRMKKVKNYHIMDTTYVESNYKDNKTLNWQHYE